MIDQSTIESLRKMKFNAMADELNRQFEDPTTYSSLGFEERLALLVDAEWNRRQANKLARYIKNARFAAPGASIEGIEYHPDRKLDKTELIRYATCAFINDGHHIILQGASGSGKTYLACAIGNAAFCAPQRSAMRFPAAALRSKTATEIMLITTFSL